jgi:hypothetical protein
MGYCWHDSRTWVVHLREAIAAAPLGPRDDAAQSETIVNGIVVEEKSLMNLWRSLTSACVLLALMGAGTVEVFAGDVPVPAVSRVEVVLADQYRNQVPALTDEFAQAGLANVHFQFAKRGQPPQNIGLGREVPADKAREAIRLALKYNLGIGILLPERLFPPRFITIASSNYDDTLEYHIDQAALAKLQDPELTTEAFHRLYRDLTSVPLEPKGRSLGKPY